MEKPPISHAADWTSTAEGMREFQRERLKLIVTEELCRVMKQQKVSRKPIDTFRAFVG